MKNIGLRNIVYMLVILLYSISAYGIEFNGPKQSCLRAQLLDYNISGIQYYYKDGNCTYNEYTVTLKATGDKDDDGNGNDEILIAVWDDGTIKDSKIIKIPVGSTQTITATLTFSGVYKTGAPGVGIYIYDDINRNTELASTDPYTPTQIERDSCTPIPTVSVPLHPLALFSLSLLIAIFGFRRFSS